MKKKGIIGLLSPLLTKVRKEVVVVKTRAFGIELYRVQGGNSQNIYTTDSDLARKIANQLRLEIARTSYQRKKEKQTFEKITKL